MPKDRLLGFLDKLHATALSGDSLDEVQRLSPSTPLNSTVDELGRTIVDNLIVQTGSDSPPRSALDYFISSFFQEKNIRWMLVIGAAIVFGSSLMLVTREWSDWPPEVQYLTILGYTAAIFGFAELSRKRLGLLATAKVLHFLTLLLLPISFLSIGWLTSQSIFDSTLSAVRAVVLLIPATILTWFASTRILDNWLRGRQMTFVVSYLVLCMAGALPALTNPWLAAITTLALGAVATGYVVTNLGIVWDTPQIVAYGTILFSVCLSTIATRHYLCGIGFWILATVGLSTWIFGAHFHTIELRSGLTFVTTTISLLVAVSIKSAYKNKSLRHTLTTLRKAIGIDSSTGSIGLSHSDQPNSAGVGHGLGFNEGNDGTSDGLE